jgi:hypothetical protein
MAPGRAVVCVGEPIEGERRELTERLRDEVSKLREEAAGHLRN